MGLPHGGGLAHVTGMGLIPVGLRMFVVIRWGCGLGPPEVACPTPIFNVSLHNVVGAVNHF